MLTKENIQDIYPLSPMQEGMFFHYLLDDSSSIYVDQTSYRFKADLNISYVEKSLNEIMKRHDVLRTVFSKKSAARLLQIVLKQREIDFFYEDISRRTDKEEYCIHFKEIDKQRGFDICKDVLMRISILRLDSKEYEFTWSFHHIIMDGWCLGTLVSEFFTIYNSLLNKSPYNPEKTGQYRSYIDWLALRDREESKKYWSTYLQGYSEAIQIPGQKMAKKSDFSYIPGQVKLGFEPDITTGLNELAGSYNITMNILIQAVWGILLGLYNGRSDVVFGAVVSGRPSEIEDVESIVGLFINTVPVRITFDQDMKFAELLLQVRKDSLASQPFHYYPLAEIQSGKILKQDLINHILVFENHPSAEQIEKISAGDRGNGIDRWEMVDFSTSIRINYDFYLVINPGQRLNLRIEYNGCKYDGVYVERIAAHISRLIGLVLSDPGLKMTELTVLSEHEKNQILFHFNQTDADYPKEKKIFQFLEEQAVNIPAGIALVYGDEHLAYRELNSMSNGLSLLMQQKGSRANMISAVMCERSLELMIGLFAILKSGGAYLPISPAYPVGRKKFMVRDSRARFLLTRDRLQNSAWYDGEIIDLFGVDHLIGIKDNPTELHPASSPAYVIYTSGSTGVPKGVIVEQRSLVNRINWMQKAYPLSRADVLIQKTPVTFDVSLWELFWWSLIGAKLFLLNPGDEKVPAALIKGSERYNITAMHFVPSMLNVFLEYVESIKDVKRLKSLRRVFASGEALTAQHVKKFNRILRETNHTALVNLYGPTEATVDVSYYNCFEGEEAEEIPIGKPIDNINLFILNKNSHILPLGIPGELCISGEGLARGYLNNPELTEDKFMTGYAMGNNDRIYRTGDLSRRLPDGNIEFLGRIDNQVKIRGFRIELGEIENRLRSCPGIGDAVVIARDDGKGDSYLCAYIVAEPAFDISLLREFASQHLPEYMTPSYILRLEKLPITANGKVDRKALPDPANVSRDTYAPPRNEIEGKLVNIWSEVLGINESVISIETNFFDLGGNSLKLITLSIRIRENFSRDIPIVKLFKYTTISALSEYLYENDESLTLTKDRSETIDKLRERLKERPQAVRGNK